jgi:hypothetical protein
LPTIGVENALHYLVCDAESWGLQFMRGNLQSKYVFSTAHVSQLADRQHYTPALTCNASGNTVRSDIDAAG